MRYSPRSLHRSEIMTSGWCSGGRVVRGRSHQAQVCAGTAGSSFLEQAASLPVPNGWGTLAPGQPVRSDRRVRRRRVYPGTRADEAQNPDRPARHEPHYNCGLPARGSSLAGPASLPPNEAGFFEQPEATWPTGTPARPGAYVFRFLAATRAAFSAMRAAIRSATSSRGNGLPGVNRTVPGEVSRSLSRSANTALTAGLCT